MTAVHPSFHQTSGFTIKSQSKTRDSSGICFYKQAGVFAHQQQAPQIVPSDPGPETNGLEELGHDYFNTYLHLNDDAFFDECGNPSKIDSTLPDLSEFGIIESPMSQDNDPFLPSFASAMLNASGENEAYRDLSPFLPSLQTYLSSNTTVPSSSYNPTPPVSLTPSQPSTSTFYTSPPPLMTPSTATFLKEESRSTSPCSSTGGGGEKYTFMRRKNNMASRRSRLSKKEKERQMDDVASQLETENQSLRQHIAQLEAVTQRLRCRLLTSVRKA